MSPEPGALVIIEPHWNLKIQMGVSLTLREGRNNRTTLESKDLYRKEVIPLKGVIIEPHWNLKISKGIIIISRL